MFSVLDHCPICNGSWQRAGIPTMTLVAYDSPPGHDHDENCVVRDFLCENGHMQTIALRNRCHCGWKTTDHCAQHGRRWDAWPKLMPERTP